MLNSLLIIICLLIKTCNLRKVLQANYYRIHGTFYLRILLGVPQKACTIEINLSTDHSFFDALYQSSQSVQSIYPKTIINPIFKIETTVDEITDLFEFHEITNEINASLTYYAIQSKNNIKSSLGMSSRFNNTLFSIIHQLKKASLIDYLSFSFHPLDANPSNTPQIGIFYSLGKMLIGDIPIEQNDGYGFCKINNTESKWSCELKAVSIGNIYTYVNNDHFVSYFQTNTFRIETPMDFMRSIINDFLKDYIDKDICEYIPMNQGYMYSFDSIKCVCQYLNEMPKISITLGNYIYMMNMSSMFISYGKFCQSIFVSYNKNEWVLGTAFIDKYITMFDYEKQSVILYTFPNGGLIEQIINNIQYISSSNSMSKYCLLIICIFNLIGICLTIRTKIKIKTII